MTLPDACRIWVLDVGTRGDPHRGDVAVLQVVNLKPAGSPAAWDLPAAARASGVLVGVCRPDRNVVLVGGIRLDAADRAPRVLVGVCGPDRNVALVSGISLARFAKVDDGHIVGIRRVLSADR